MLSENIINFRQLSLVSMIGKCPSLLVTILILPSFSNAASEDSDLASLVETRSLQPNFSRLKGISYLQGSPAVAERRVVVEVSGG